MATDPVRPEDARAELYADFRPRMTRIFANTAIVILVLGAAAIIVTSPGMGGLFAYNVVDVIGILLLLGGCVWLLSRHGAVHAWVDENGIRVRNLVYTTDLVWAQVESVRFGSGRPWVQLDLTNGHVLAVMAIQSADGAYGVHEARRLATLVAGHGEGHEPPATTGHDG